MLNDKGNFDDYVDIIETLLLASPRNATTPKGHQAVPENDDEEQRSHRHLLAILWRQLIVTVNSFAARCIEVKRYVHMQSSPDMHVL